MRRSSIGVLVAALVVEASLPGCASLGSGGITNADNRQSATLQVSLLSLLPGMARAHCPGADGIHVIPEDLHPNTLEGALVAFNHCPSVEARNAVVSSLMAASDVNCDEYMTRFRANQATWRTSLDLGGSVLTAAAGIVSDQRSSQILSVLSGASTGSSAVLDRDIVAGFAVEIINDAIQTRRATLRAQIDNRMQHSSYAEWPVETALRDTFYYHGRCSITEGAQLARASAATSRTQAESKTGEVTGPANTAGHP